VTEEVGFDNDRGLVVHHDALTGEVEFDERAISPRLAGRPAKRQLPAAGICSSTHRMPADELFFDLCIIGAGAAGLTTAAIAAQLGLSCALIERAQFGGECLNTGCVPSKALLAAARAAQDARTSRRLGVDATPRVDFAAVYRHVRGVIEAIAPKDSAERFAALGVEVIHAEARFVGARRLVAGNRTIRARRVVIAAGSAPVIPPIPGIDTVPFHTNETIFQNDRRPAHLVIVGAGPIGVELAQAYHRLGAAVSVVEAEKALAGDDPELTAELLGGLAAEGVAIYEHARIARVERNQNGIALLLDQGGRQTRIEGSDLLVAAGRRPRIEALDLDRAGIRYTSQGIHVDRRLRTSASGVYAIGDVVGGPRFTHVAGYHAGIVIRNALFRLPARVDYAALPRVTYTDPELAQVGSTEAEALRRYGKDAVVIRVPFTANDRAQTERDIAGTVKIVARRSGRVLGASILGRHAGELSHLWVLAIEQRLKLKDVARLLAPYPTWGEAAKSAAIEFYKPRFFGPWTRRLVRALARLP
jgi:pyruvate/2-oxoglutarate dehydrogenase complex dihydrolipoamide dehydrogenase (E3) component